MTFEELQEVARAKRCILTKHMPVTGTYFQIRDSLTGEVIAKRDTLIEIEDALSWVDQP